MDHVGHGRSVMADVIRLSCHTLADAMLAFLLGMIVEIANGATAARLFAVDAFAALETPPRNPTARRWAVLALSLFLIASALILTAALVDWFTGRRLISGCFGWTGVVCLQLCIVCVARYAVANRKATINVNSDLPHSG